MAGINVTGKTKPLPQKIEKRLAELMQMGEFDKGDVNHCRAAYWSARDDWHKILIDCYEEAKRRKQQETVMRTSALNRTTKTRE